MLREGMLDSSAPWLTFRCRFALLRALRFLDEGYPFGRGYSELQRLMCEMVSHVPQGPPEVPWPLRDEPVLASLYEASLAAFKLDLETPTVEEYLLKLVAGKRVTNGFLPPASNFVYPS